MTHSYSTINKQTLLGNFSLSTPLFLCMAQFRMLASIAVIVLIIQISTSVVIPMAVVTTRVTMLQVDISALVWTAMN